MAKYSRVAEIFQNLREGKAMMKTTLTEEDKQKYVKSGGAVCPYCGEWNVEGAFCETNEGFASQKMFCTECEKSWYDIYTLTAIQTEV